MMRRPIRYPDLNSIVKTYQPQRLLGRELVWEAKEDGSNLMVWLDEDEIRISSRNMDDNTWNKTKAYDMGGIL